MRKVILRALLCAPMLVVAGPVMARQPAPETPITVTAGQESIAHWASRVGRDLNDNLVYPHMLGVSGDNEGIVRVAFRCSDGGTPSDVHIYKSSGHHELDRAAMRAVNKLSTLHQRPDGISAGMPMQAWIVMALSEDSQKRMLASLNREAQLANAAAQNKLTERAGADEAPLVLLAAR